MFWSLFIPHRLPAQEPASITCGNEQSDLFYSAGQHGNLQFCRPTQEPAIPQANVGTCNSAGQHRNLQFCWPTREPAILQADVGTCNSAGRYGNLQFCRPTWEPAILHVDVGTCNSAGQHGNLQFCRPMWEPALATLNTWEKNLGRGFVKKCSWMDQDGIN